MSIAARSDERRLLALAAVTSIAVHAAALALGPRWQREDQAALAVPPPMTVIVALPSAITPPVEPEAAPAAPAVPVAKRVAPLPERAPLRVLPRREPASPAPTASIADRDADAEADPVASERRAEPSQEPRQETSSGSAPSPAVAAPRLGAAYLRAPPPRYPAAARRKGEEGTVVLKVLVTAEGAASSVELERSSGSSALDDAARDAVKGWLFAPARRGAEPVETWVLVPVVFRLDGRG
jgi:periplasmic protein TonB